MSRLPSAILERRTSATLRVVVGVLLATLCLLGIVTFAHDVSGADALFITGLTGPAPIPYLYLGAKHMVTGYDHLLYLAGVIFFLVRLRDIALYVSLFTIGHSLTLILGVLFHTHVNEYLIDAIIGLSVVYKAIENMGGFRSIPFIPDTRIAVFVFGLFHGLGLATKLQELVSDPEGLLINLVSFNFGVELGQFYALLILFLLFTTFRKTLEKERVGLTLNSLLMIGGCLLVAYQLTGYFIGSK